MLKWLDAVKPDILFLQETKALPEQLDDEVKKPPGYQSFWFSASKRGYSGVAAFVKDTCVHDDVVTGISIPDFDSEGRVMTVIVGDLAIVNAYFPNSQREHARLPYKLAFNEEMQRYCARLQKQGKKVIVTGDFNVAHEEIDLKNPKENENNAGFLPQEREWMSKFLSSGFIDSFRQLNPNARDRYSWWSFRPGIRQRNIGWRIDYFCIEKALMDRLRSAEIHHKIMGSDHCPVSLTLSTDR
jgi:exodeoxyribonuclease-3